MQKTQEIKICLIFPYFGKWPEYMKFFYAGIKLNPEFDFLFFSDDQQPTYLKGKNIIYHQLSIDEFNSLATEKLGFKISIKNGYKLCDFRPLFADIFEMHIKKYDYWGYGDVDVIYGKLLPFIQSAVKKNYDVITTKRRYLYGALTFYKNTQEIRTLYKQSKGYKEILQSDKSEIFDEGGTHQNRHIESISRVVKRLTTERKITSYFKTNAYDYSELQNSKSNSWCLEWTKHGLKDIATGKSVMFFHSLIYKSKPSFYPDWKKMPDKFYISQFGLATNLDQVRVSYFNFFYPRTHALLNAIDSKYWSNVVNLPDITINYYLDIYKEIISKTNSLQVNDILKLECTKEKIRKKSSIDTENRMFWRGRAWNPIKPEFYNTIDITNTSFRVNKYVSFLNSKWNWDLKEISKNLSLKPSTYKYLLFAHKEPSVIDEIIVDEATSLVVLCGKKDCHFQYIYNSVLNHVSCTSENEKLIVKFKVIEVIRFLLIRGVFLVLKESQNT